MTLTAQFQADVSGNRRYAARRPLRLATTLGTSDADAVIHDLSVTGLLLETAEDVSVNDLLLIDIPNFGPVPATIVWNSGRFFGCRFDRPISPAAVSGALLRNPFANSHSAPGTADEELCIDVPLRGDEVESDKLPLATRLVVGLVLAVAAAAPIAILAAVLG